MTKRICLILFFIMFMNPFFVLSQSSGSNSDVGAKKTTSAYQIYRENAVVSYYAGDFHGKKTSNGEHFNMNDLTCASKTLPFNTVLIITNHANGKTVQVRVNDRGPFVPGRELDLSRAAAQKLDMIKSGTAKVRIEIIKKGPDTKLSRQTAAKAQKIMKQRFPGASVQTAQYAPGTIWDIQLGSFSSREGANRLAQKLLKDGFKDVVFQKGNGIYRVVIRRVSAEKVPEIEQKLNKAGYNEYLIRQRNKAS